MRDWKSEKKRERRSSKRCRRDGMGWDGNVVKHNDTWDEKSTGPNEFWHEFP
jgi:hypothetical protein